MKPTNVTIGFTIALLCYLSVSFITANFFLTGNDNYLSLSLQVAPLMSVQAILAPFVAGMKRKDLFYVTSMIAFANGMNTLTSYAFLYNPLRFGDIMMAIMLCFAWITFVWLAFNKLYQENKRIWL